MPDAVCKKRLEEILVEEVQSMEKNPKDLLIFQHKFKAPRKGEPTKWSKKKYLGKKKGKAYPSKYERAR